MGINHIACKWNFLFIILKKYRMLFFSNSFSREPHRCVEIWKGSTRLILVNYLFLKSTQNFLQDGNNFVFVAICGGSSHILTGLYVYTHVYTYIAEQMSLTLKFCIPVTTGIPSNPLKIYLSTMVQKATDRSSQIGMDIKILCGVNFHIIW